ncbi:SDR family NAD(P)-dependent oxidoreductase [Nannocystis pusilla]|uniref:SDR family NAD(P)-dependent oxidoreductase n=1 Tax=Nannocystis pusilla TaxID=889268 RepID=UPI003B79265A
MELKDRVALVTGASSGIGLATAKLLHQSGMRVVMVARTAAKLEAAAAEVGTGAVAIACDVGDLSRLTWLIDQVVMRFGGLDVLVNNAGVHHRGDMLRHPPEALAEIVTVNLTAPVALTRIAADHMRAGGCVVNVASLAGKLGVPGSAVYSGSKAGLRFWALAAAEDLARRDIRIANVNPGPVDSSFFDSDIQGVSNLTFSQPMSTPEQCAEAVLACIQDTRSPVEIDLPFASGKLATLGYLSPRLRVAAAGPGAPWRQEQGGFHAPSWAVLGRGRARGFSPLKCRLRRTILARGWGGFTSVWSRRCGRARRGRCWLLPRVHGRSSSSAGTRPRAARSRPRSSPSSSACWADRWSSARGRGSRPSPASVRSPAAASI